jgi:hypothetical protein
MAKQRKRADSNEVLRYSLTPRYRSTVRRHYLMWRVTQHLPLRCDNEACRFHTEALTWNQRKLPLILDHRNGNSSDNHLDNLRLLCPNCDAQLETRGGANRGRVENSEGGFALVSRDGKRDYVLPAESGHLAITGHAPTVVITKRKQQLTKS